MKKVIFALIAMVASGAVVNAASVNVSDAETSITTTQEEKVKIKAEELPEAIRTALKGEDYKGWEISEAYKYTQKEQFEVVLKKDAEVKTVKFDKDGNVID